MDRTTVIIGGSFQTKPHARGDGPRTMVAVLGSTCQAPRTWGWTAHDDGRARIDMPSPTHVGMDRLMERAGAPCLGVAHARGDGTRYECGPGLAYVGMDRLMEQTGLLSLAKPHARGDGPLFECGPGLA